MMRAWMKGEYHGISRQTIAVLAATALYFVSPIDVIPDWILGLGQIDDAAVIAIAMNSLRGQLELYRAWREQQKYNTRRAA